MIHAISHTSEMEFSFESMAKTEEEYSHLEERGVVEVLLPRFHEEEEDEEEDDGPAALEKVKKAL